MKNRIVSFIFRATLLLHCNSVVDWRVDKLKRNKAITKVTERCKKLSNAIQNVIWNGVRNQNIIGWRQIHSFVSARPGNRVIKLVFLVTT